MGRALFSAKATGSTCRQLATPWFSSRVRAMEKSERRISKPSVSSAASRKASTESARMASTLT